jgi:hypothetical protein
VHSILLLVRFRAVGAGFDAALRDALQPGTCLAPGLRAVFAGRMGPGDEGERLLASVWADDDAAQAAVDADRAPVPLVGALHGTPDGLVERLPVAVTLEPAEASRISIMRVVSGITRAGQLDGYLDEARAGTLADRAIGEGPLALYLAVDPPARFVTLSLWGGWSHVEAATGADHEHVDRTRHAERLATWTAEHYEVIPGLAVVDPAPAEAGDLVVDGAAADGVVVDATAAAAIAPTEVVG